MESLADLLEQELEEAVEVKNKRSLHRYITLLAENLVMRDRSDREHSEFREAFIRIDTRIEEGFRRMDQRFEHEKEQFKRVDKRFEQVEKRFEQVDKRFEQVDRRFEQMDGRFESLQHSMDRRFNMMFRFMSLGFIIIATLMSVYQFLA